MKTITVICESFNRRDLHRVQLPPTLQAFHRASFDMRPAYDSVSALQLLQRGECRWFEDRRNAELVFDESQDLLALGHRTRLVAQRWPSQCNAGLLDPEAAAHLIPTKQLDREGPHWRVVDFLRYRFYRESYDHLIYWGTHGHVNHRQGAENSGVPRRLSRTLHHWLWLLERDVMPLVDLRRTAVLVHPDHGSARAGMDSRLAMTAGFLWAHAPGPLDFAAEYTWTSLRDLTRRLLRAT